MIFNDRQIRFFGAKQVAEREWHRQNRLREPFIRQYEARLKSYYNKMATEVFEAYNTGSTTILNIKINNFRKDLFSKTITWKKFSDYINNDRAVSGTVVFLMQKLVIY